MEPKERETFLGILNEHAKQYPRMEPQDYGKLIYQNVFGPEHMIGDEQTAIAYLKDERNSMPIGMHEVGVDVVSEKLCRFPLSFCSQAEELALLAKLFLATAKEAYGTWEGLFEKIELASLLGVRGMDEWMIEWKQRGCPAVHHSNVYRAAYRPHYRLLKKEYAVWFAALCEIDRKCGMGRSALVAVDGRCGSGKTRFAQFLQELFCCNVFHMDDFFLPEEQRCNGWEKAPGGNMDFERLRLEVLEPCVRGEEVSYRAYNCQKGSYEEPKRYPSRRLTVVEGSYSHHPLLRDVFDLNIFFTCAKDVQSLRLKAREGDYFFMFEERWIPMEERYIASYDVEKKSDFTVDTSTLFSV